MRALPILSEEQQAAYDRIAAFLNADQVEKPYLVIHGLAGSGKTTLLAHVATEFPHAFICTLAAKAADVLRTKTGMPTSTIHSVFYKLRQERSSADGRSMLDFDPLHGADDLFGSAVLLDECSMIDTDMAADILNTGIRVVACGDPGQLPPVKGSQFFRTPDITLKQIHRQALDSPIIRQAHWVRLGRDYSPDTDDFRVLPHVTKEDVLAADTVLCWRNATRQAVNGIVRRYRGFTANHPVAGEPVVCLKNSAEHGVFNGATYTLVRDFHNGDNEIEVEVGGQSDKDRTRSP